MRRIFKRTTVLLFLMAAFTSVSFAGNYADVQENAWYNTSINYVTEHGLMNGTGSNQFRPELPLTRGMFVTILGRMAGISPEEYESTSFADVSSERYYSPYITWAFQQGITSGMDGDNFAPDQNVTREQMAVFIFRYVTYAGVTLSESENPASSFSDEVEVSNYAKDALEFMRKTGIILSLIHI